METSRFLCSVTGYHGPLNGVLWLCVLGHVDPGRELALIPAILVIKILRVFKPASTLLGLLSGAAVDLPHTQAASPLCALCPPHSSHCGGSLCRLATGWWASRRPSALAVGCGSKQVSSPPVQCSGGQQVCLPPVPCSLDLIDFYEF